jgi:hypothetical protein
MTDDNFIKDAISTMIKSEGYNPYVFNYGEIARKIGPEALAEYMTGDDYIQSLKPISATCSCGKLIIINPTSKYMRCPLCNTLAWPRKV